jgi:hypothetical protein
MTSHDDLSPAIWVKSSYSANGNCVEAARLAGGRVALRDSESPSRTPVDVPEEEFRLFLDILGRSGTNM